MSGIIVEALVDENRTVVEVEDTSLFIGGTTPALIEIFHGPPGPTGTDATTIAKGVVQLAGDLAGTAAAPTVPGLALKVDTSSKGVANGVASLDSTGKVPAAQVPSASDATPTVKGVIQLAGHLSGTAASPTVPGLATKLDSSQKGAASGVAALDSSGLVAAAHRPPVDPEQVQDLVAAMLIQGPGVTLSYSDASNLLTISASGTTSPDATTTVKGIIQLAGALGGTAAAPTVPGLALKIDTSQKGAVSGVAALDSGGLLAAAHRPPVDPEQVMDTVATMLVAGSNVTIAYDDLGNTLTISSTGSGGTASDATTTTKGIIQLAGDLGGTAAAPTVPGKISTSEKGAANGVATLGADSRLASGQAPIIPDATTGVKGLIQLANHLGGTAAAPTVPGLATKLEASEKGAVSGVASLDASGLLTTAQRPPVVDATASVKGGLLLAGDLSGTAALPTVPKLMSSQRVYRWNSTTSTYQDAAGVNVATESGRNWFRQFVGPSNPSAAMISGDSWFDTTSTATPVMRYMVGTALVPVASGGGGTTSGFVRPAATKTISPDVSLTAVWNGLSAGDVVYMNSGTYGAVDNRWNITSAGTSAAPIQIYAAPGATVIIKGMVVFYGAYVKVGDVTFDGPTGFVNAGSNAGLGTAAGEGESDQVWINTSNVTLENCIVQKNNWNAGVYITGSNNIVQNCWIYNNGAWHDPYRLQNGGAANNLCHGIYIDSGAGNIVRNCLIEHNLAFGVQIYQYPSTTLVYNNTIVDNGYDGATNGMLGGAIIALSSGLDNRVWNNILANHGGAAVNTLAQTGTTTYENNMSWNNGSAYEANTGHTYVNNYSATNPSFASTSPGGWRLSAGSAAINMGIATSGPWSSPTVDKDWFTRTGAPDMGCYEYR